MDNKYYLALYDVRGIQDYIFRTPKLSEAIGASYLVSEIIKNALMYSVNEEKKTNDFLRYRLDWFDDLGNAYDYDGTMDIEVMYIGGGNACVMYKDCSLYKRINKRMSRYVIEKTYSLQLACASVEKSENYAADYEELQKRLTNVKDSMVMSAPLGALPIMRTEISTGYPAIDINGIEYSSETKIKKENAEKAQADLKYREKQNDLYRTKKGVDSLMAVVHIDGNNMGIRIRSLIQDIQDYKVAIKKMREISYRINYSYNKVFEDMRDYFNINSKNVRNFSEVNKKQYFIRKVIVGGDDITYVCNANIAMASVEYFARHISEMAMIESKDKESTKRYGFSICAGVAYHGAHYPFNVAYDVAEACCDSAKTKAKKEENMEIKDGYSRIGNFVDFQFCKNIQVRNLDVIRKKEYITKSGENLLKRPYYIETEYDTEMISKNKDWSFKDLGRYIDLLNNEKRIPRSFAKRIRNTYPEGKKQVDLLISFIQSRGHQLPDGDYEMYDGTTAKYYDALELMDNYISLKSFEEKEQGNE